MGFFDRLFGKAGSDKPDPKQRAIQPPPIPSSELKSAYPIIETTGKDAVQRWLQLREEGSRAGFYPVIIGDAEERSRVVGAEIEAHPDEVSKTLAAAAKLDPVTFFERRKGGAAEYYGHVELGEWPKMLPAPMPITVISEIRSGKTKAQVFIAKIPTTKGYEVPAYLAWGGWNECPMPEEHVAVLRHWNEVYGGEIISLTGDVLECTVSRPPTDKEAAFRLAHEQFLYCADIVYQGVDTLYTLAAQLMNSRNWYFWWD